MNQNTHQFCRLLLSAVLLTGATSVWGHGAGGHYDHARTDSFDHDFDRALASLEQVVAEQPRHGAAWLQIASISLVRGNTMRAARACRHAAGFVDPIASLACRGRIGLVTGDFARPFDTLRRLLTSAHYASRVDDQTVWAVGVTAELAVAMGDTESADLHFKRALAARAEGQILVAYADHLLASGRPGEVLRLPPAGATDIAAALRRLQAQKQLGQHELTRESISRYDLAFRSAISKGDFRHAREFALFYLDLLPNPDLAFISASNNLEFQREPEDLLLWERAIRSGVSRRDPV